MKLLKFFKTILKSIIVAFSVYSKIPMPKFEWASDDMKYHLCFFPWVGALIAVLEWILYCFFQAGTFGKAFFVLFALALPLLVTGGFHVDGFMDTMDALHSYQPKDKKLEILKDPHIGAFAVISLLVFVLLAACFLSEVDNNKAVAAVLPCCFISRALSGIAVTCFPKAKKDGMLADASAVESKKVVLISLVLQLAGAVAFMVCASAFSFVYCGAVLAVVSLFFAWFYFMSRREFGGITGDLCGFFVTVAEFIAVAAVSLCCIFLD